MAENILTRKYGGVPGWAIGGAAGVLGLAFFLTRKAKDPSTAAQAGTDPNAGSMLNNPAASSIPYVPSVTVTGIPSSPQSSAPVAGSPSQTQTAVVTAAGSKKFSPNGTANSTGARSAPTYNSSITRYIPVGSQVTITGTGFPDPTNSDTTWLPTDRRDYVWNMDITITGGSGGWGQAGATNPIGMFGWTSGWSPVGGGAAGTVLSQRAGLQTAGSGGRFDYGGAGSGDGASSKVNRTSTNRAHSPRSKLNRRQLSGRR
jgi:hypothetical protein